MTSPQYEQRLAQWHLERENSLRRENGWLALAGLFWLEQGENTLGSAPHNQVLLPPRLPASVGSIQLRDKETHLKVEPGIQLMLNGEPVSEALLISDIGIKPGFMTLDGVRMVVIDRSVGLGIRLWDNLRPERREYPPRRWFPTNELLVFPARYERYAEPRKVLLPDVFGDLVETSMQGRVIFEQSGQTHTLEAAESENGHLEIHFQDLTNRKNTYPSGRYYYSPDPVEDGKLTLDFNYSYSPPCAFTPFATCAFAPAENHLPFSVEAGEIYPAHA